jgi:hypothetical protein
MASRTAPDVLAALLVQASERLRTLGYERWANWLQRDRELIEAGDLFGVTHLLSAFGGMGSINDLVTDDVLDDLLGRIYSVANDLKRAEAKR